MKRKNSLLDFLVRKGPTKFPNTIPGLPLEKPVEILWDRLGIPHLFAQNERDLFAAQGFVHAYDRLWQMETIRRISTGTLAELAGEQAADLDHFCRIAGFPDLQRRALQQIDPANWKQIDGYVEGINAYLDMIGDNWPLEFQSLKMPPQRWTRDDLLGPIAVNAWFLQTNYLEEILALQLRNKINAEHWRELFGADPRVRLPAEGFFDRWGKVKIGPLLPAALAFYPDLKIPSGGSNNWVVAQGEDGKPLLANDPHLDSGVPQIWHFCHLHCPTLNVCGSSMPGFPGIVIGRNEKVAWGFTNVMTDCVDFFLLDVDAEQPTRYRVGERFYDMAESRETIRIAGAPDREVTFYRTQLGPVLTQVEAGVEAVAVLKWYGTLDEGVLEDRSANGFFELMRADSVDQAIESARLLGSIGQNMVCADTEGHIGWIATGRIPKRRGYSGRLPADGSSGDQDWDGFVPASENPCVIDPPQGWIVTSNHRTVDDNYPHHITYGWQPTYRFDRIVGLLSELKEPTMDSFQAIQRDICSSQAEKLLPGVLNRTYTDPLALEAIGILKDWDYRLTTESRPGIVFQTFYQAFIEIVLEDLLGDALRIYLALVPIIFSVFDLFLDPKRLTESKLLGSRTLDKICEQSLARAIKIIEQALGKNRSKWSWGALHQYHYQHPGAQGFLATWLLNRGPYPAAGSAMTVSMANYNLSKTEILRKYDVTTVPSLRLVTSLADIDRTLIMGPMGQSGRPGLSHYADMIEPWMQGQGQPLPLSREGAEKITVRRTVLKGS